MIDNNASSSDWKAYSSPRVYRTTYAIGFATSKRCQRNCWRKHRRIYTYRIIDTGRNGEIRHEIGGGLSYGQGSGIAGISRQFGKNEPEYRRCRRIAIDRVPVHIVWRLPEGPASEL